MLRRIDAFGKPRDDIRSKSVWGGIITTIASATALLLFVAQLWVYFSGSTKHSLHLSPSVPAEVPRLDMRSLHNRERKVFLKFHVTFPHIKCFQLQVAHDSLPESHPTFAESHGRDAIKKKAMTPTDYFKSTGSKQPPTVDTLQNGCTVTGRYTVPKVGGTFSVTMDHRTWAEVTTVLMMGNYFPTGPNDRQRQLPEQHRYNTT